MMLRKVLWILVLVFLIQMQETEQKSLYRQKHKNVKKSYSKNSRPFLRRRTSVLEETQSDLYEFNKPFGFVHNTHELEGRTNRKHGIGTEEIYAEDENIKKPLVIKDKRLKTDASFASALENELSIRKLMEELVVKSKLLDAELVKESDLAAMEIKKPNSSENTLIQGLEEYAKIVENQTIEKPMFESANHTVKIDIMKLFKGMTNQTKGSDLNEKPIQEEALKKAIMQHYWQQVLKKANAMEAEKQKAEEEIFTGIKKDQLNIILKENSKNSTKNFLELSTSPVKTPVEKVDSSVTSEAKLQMTALKQQNMRDAIKSETTTANSKENQSATTFETKRDDQSQNPKLALNTTANLETQTEKSVEFAQTNTSKDNIDTDDESLIATIEDEENEINTVKPAYDIQDRSNALIRILNKEDLKEILKQQNKDGQFDLTSVSSDPHPEDIVALHLDDETLKNQLDFLQQNAPKIQKHKEVLNDKNVLLDKGVSAKNDTELEAAFQQAVQVQLSKLQENLKNAIDFSKLFANLTKADSAEKIVEFPVQQTNFNNEEETLELPQHIQFYNEDFEPPLIIEQSVITIDNSVKEVPHTQSAVKWKTTEIPVVITKTTTEETLEKTKLLPKEDSNVKEISNTTAKIEEATTELTASKEKPIENLVTEMEETAVPWLVNINQTLTTIALDKSREDIKTLPTVYQNKDEYNKEHKTTESSLSIPPDSIFKEKVEETTAYETLKEDITPTKHTTEQLTEENGSSEKDKINVSMFENLEEIKTNVTEDATINLDKVIFETSTENIGDDINLLEGFKPIENSSVFEKNFTAKLDYLNEEHVEETTVSYQTYDYETNTEKLVENSVLDMISNGTGYLVKNESTTKTSITEVTKMEAVEELQTTMTPEVVKVKDALEIIEEYSTKPNNLNELMETTTAALSAKEDDDAGEATNLETTTLQSLIQELKVEDRVSGQVVDLKLGTAADATEFHMTMATEVVKVKNALEIIEEYSTKPNNLNELMETTTAALSAKEEDDAGEETNLETTTFQSLIQELKVEDHVSGQVVDLKLGTAADTIDLLGTGNLDFSISGSKIFTSKEGIIKETLKETEDKSPLQYNNTEKTEGLEKVSLDKGNDKDNMRLEQPNKAQSDKPAVKENINDTEKGTQQVKDESKDGLPIKLKEFMGVEATKPVDKNTAEIIAAVEDNMGLDVKVKLEDLKKKILKVNKNITDKIENRIEKIAEVAESSEKGVKKPSELQESHQIKNETTGIPLESSNDQITNISIAKDKEKFNVAESQLIEDQLEENLKDDILLGSSENLENKNIENTTTAEHKKMSEETTTAVYNAAVDDEDLALSYSDETKEEEIDEPSLMNNGKEKIKFMNETSAEEPDDTTDANNEEETAVDNDKKDTEESKEIEYVNEMVQELAAVKGIIEKLGNTNDKESTAFDKNKEKEVKMEVTTAANKAKEEEMDKPLLMDNGKEKLKLINETTAEGYDKISQANKEKLTAVENYEKVKEDSEESEQSYVDIPIELIEELIEADEFKVDVANKDGKESIAEDNGDGGEENTEESVEVGVENTKDEKIQQNASDVGVMVKGTKVSTAKDKENVKFVEKLSAEDFNLASTAMINETTVKKELPVVGVKIENNNKLKEEMSAESLTIESNILNREDAEKVNEKTVLENSNATEEVIKIKSESIAEDNKNVAEEELEKNGQITEKIIKVILAAENDNMATLDNENSENVKIQNTTAESNDKLEEELSTVDTKKEIEVEIKEETTAPVNHKFGENFIKISSIVYNNENIAENSEEKLVANNDDIKVDKKLASDMIDELMFTNKTIVGEKMVEAMPAKDNDNEDGENYEEVTTKGSDKDIEYEEESKLEDIAENVGVKIVQEAELLHVEDNFKNRIEPIKIGDSDVIDSNKEDVMMEDNSSEEIKDDNSTEENFNIKENNAAESSTGINDRSQEIILNETENKVKEELQKGLAMEDKAKADSNKVKKEQMTVSPNENHNNLEEMTKQKLKVEHADLIEATKIKNATTVDLNTLKEKIKMETLTGENNLEVKGITVDSEEKKNILQEKTTTDNQKAKQESTVLLESQKNKTELSTMGNDKMKGYNVESNMKAKEEIMPIAFVKTEKLAVALDRTIDENTTNENKKNQNAKRREKPEIKDDTQITEDDKIKSKISKVVENSSEANEEVTKYQKSDKIQEEKKHSELNELHLPNTVQYKIQSDSLVNNIKPNLEHNVEKIQTVQIDKEKLKQMEINIAKKNNTLNSGEKLNANTNKLRIILSTDKNAEQEMKNNTFKQADKFPDMTKTLTTEVEDKQNVKIDKGVLKQIEINVAKKQNVKETMQNTPTNNDELRVIVSKKDIKDVAKSENHSEKEKINEKSTEYMKFIETKQNNDEGLTETKHSSTSDNKNSIKKQQQTSSNIETQKLNEDFSSTVNCVTGDSVDIAMDASVKNNQGNSKRLADDSIKTSAIKRIGLVLTEQQIEEDKNNKSIEKELNDENDKVAMAVTAIVADEVDDTDALVVNDFTDETDDVATLKPVSLIRQEDNSSMQQESNEDEEQQEAHDSDEIDIADNEDDDAAEIETEVAENIKYDKIENKNQMFADNINEQDKTKHINVAEINHHIDAFVDNIDSVAENTADNTMHHGNQKSPPTNDKLPAPTELTVTDAANTKKAAIDYDVKNADVFQADDDVDNDDGNVAGFADTTQYHANAQSIAALDEQQHPISNWWSTLHHAEIRKFLNSIFNDAADEFYQEIARQARVELQEMPPQRQSVLRQNHRKGSAAAQWLDDAWSLW